MWNLLVGFDRGALVVRQPPVPVLGERLEKVLEKARCSVRPVGEGVLGFGVYELDLGRRELRRDGRAGHLEPQVFDVLAHLVAHRDRVVTKSELLDEVWGSRFVSDSAVTS